MVIGRPEGKAGGEADGSKRSSSLLAVEVRVVSSLCEVEADPDREDESKWLASDLEGLRGWDLPVFEAGPEGPSRPLLVVGARHGEIYGRALQVGERPGLEKGSWPSGEGSGAKRLQGQRYEVVGDDGR